MPTFLTETISNYESNSSQPTTFVVSIISFGSGLISLIDYKLNNNSTAIMKLYNIKSN